MSGAIAFIETMDASSLSAITQEEFEKNVEAAIQELPPSPSTQMSRPLVTEMSPFAPLSLDAKRFLLRTGGSMQEAVSKPLSAIGKILENIQEDDTKVQRPRAVTPESPSRRFSHLGIDPMPGSGR